MRNLLGIINLAEPTAALGELTRHRTLGAVPFGGRYRLIDFTLSSMINAGIRNVGILLMDRFGPLLDHIKDGKEWDLDRQRDGMFLLAPPSHLDGGVNLRGEISNLKENRLYLEKSRQEQVLFCGSKIVANIDFREAYRFHLEKEADLTLICSQRESLANNRPFTALAADQGGEVKDLAVNPRRFRSGKIFLEMFFLSKRLLLALLDYGAARGKRHLFTEVIMPRLGELRISAFEHPSYVGAVHCLSSYYGHSLELLQPLIWQDLFFKHGQIRTKVKHEAPVRYLKGSRVTNSLIASGCTIEGTVENSLLFRGVEVGPGVEIRDSVLLQKVRLGPEVRLKNVIVDKDASISPGKILTGDPHLPLVIGKMARL